MRNAEIVRDTAETKIRLTLELDGRGECLADTQVGFLDHMLTLFAKHGRFDLAVKCEGDVYVDAHHTTEDVGIALGLAFKKALRDKRGICRYGDTVLPMDEALILTAADFSGRAYLGWDLPLAAQKVGDFDTELVKEFFQAFVRTAECTLHVRELAGENTHHVIEGAFKSFARTLRKAAAVEEAFRDEIPSTKGVL